MPLKRRRNTTISKARVNKNTIKYLDKKIAKSMWSKQQYSVRDFDIIQIGTDEKYNLSSDIVSALLEDDMSIFKNGTYEKSTNGDIAYTLDIKIDYIKWQLRYALGENETTSAVSQNVREIFFRCDDQYDEVALPSNIKSLCDDHDGNIHYTNVYGSKMGVYSDKMMYLKTQSADSDTSVGGQQISKGYKVLNITDTYSALAGSEYTAVQSEKGQICLEVLADDPSGENCNMYGYVEIGWRYKNN